MSRRTNFTSRRRAELARKVAKLEALEPRSMITESLGIMMLGIGVQTSATIGSKNAGSAQTQTLTGERHRPASLTNTSSISIATPAARPKPTGGGSRPDQSAMAPAAPKKVKNDDGWLNLSRKAQSDQTFSQTTPVAPQTGGGATQGGGGGGANPSATTRGAITPLIAPAPQSSQSGVVTGAASPTSTAPVPVGHPASNAAALAPGSAQPAAAGAPSTPDGLGLGSFGGGHADVGVSQGPTPTDPGLFHVTGANPGVALNSFAYFPMYVLDFDDGTVLFPGAVQVGTNSGSVDLRAQVKNTTVSTYSWTTSGTDILSGSISGGSTSRLQFQWDFVGAGQQHTDTVTLAVTNSSSQTETQTFTFVIANTTGGATTVPSWPQAISPDTALAGTDSIADQNVSVASVSGALDTSITLPTYNPNIPALALTYDSSAANPMPIFLADHPLDPTLAVPTQVSAQLTFNGTAGTTYYYDTSGFIPGDIQQVALQANATSLATGRYAYTVSIGDIRGTTTTTTINGTATILNGSTNPIGSGWTVSGLEQIDSASGGVILEQGSQDQSLWFTGSFGSGGGTFTNPGGEFSTLVQNSGGSYTRTLTDGSVLHFNSSGQETSSVDRNGLATTFAYSSGELSTITDAYSNITTFAYSSGYLSTITDPASRVATFTHSGANLTGVTLPDSSTWAYTYDSGGRLTQVTDPNSKTVSVTYDSAERVSTITRPDSSVEKFVADQEEGWVASGSGTSGSPASATLLAEAAASYTDPLGNLSQTRPDWYGEALTNQTTDPLGNITTTDRDVNGLATISIDQDNRVTRESYDSVGNPLTITYPGLNTDHYTYNSFSEPLTHTDGNGNTTNAKYTYDGDGDNTVVRDPLNNLTTMTYTADGMVATVKDADSHTTSYAYDSQDRVTTVTNPDSTTDLVAYDAKGNPATVTDERGNVTAYRYDALNRTVGTTDALGDVVTYVYDLAGNLTADEEPLSRTTSYAYDSMNRATTVTDPLGHATVTAYDSGGNVASVTDPLSRETSYTYNAQNLPTVVKDPLNKLTTTAYDAAGQSTSVEDPMTGLTTYSYSSNGWLSTETNALGQVVTYTYSGTGKELSQSDPSSSGGLYMQYTYDADDREITATDELGHTTTTTFDGVGNVIASTDANSHTTSYSYDSRNRLTTVTDALSHTTVYGYDSGGNQTSVTDGLGHTTTTLYDALNRATTVTDALGDTTKYVFDSGGRQTVVVDPVGNRTTTAFDAADRATTVTTGAGTATYVYDSDNELTDETDFDDRRVTFSYDNNGRETGETWFNASGGSTNLLTYTYDNVGDMTGAADSSATLTFTYDSGGNQLTAETSSPGGQPDVTLTSAYDALNVRTTLADNISTGATISYEYDLAHRVTTIALATVGGSAIVEEGYDAANNVTSITRGNLPSGGSHPVYLTSTLSYDAANRLTTMIDQSHVFVSGGSGGYSTTALGTYVYGYDNANRLTSEQNVEGTVSYSYDVDNELTGASGSRAETYTYDSGGNRTMTGYTTGTDNEQTAAPGASYSYDAEGNLTSETLTASHDVWSFSYDDRNRMTVAIEKTSGGTTLSQSTYTYDPLNRRIETNVNSTKTLTVYDGANPYADFTLAGSGGASLAHRYLFGPAVDRGDNT